MENNSESPRTVTDAQLKQEEVDDFLKRKRKVREHKACYPCRQRKVKCDLGRPCKTCSERQHPELCNYHPPTKRQNLGLAPVTGLHTEDDGTEYSAGASATVSQLDFPYLCRKLEKMESAIDELRKELRAANGMFTSRNSDLSGPPTPLANARTLDVFRPDLPLSPFATPAFHTKHALTGQTVHLGPSSVPAMVMALGQGNREQPDLQEVLGKSILPLFGLDNETATYPFIDLSGLQPNGQAAKLEQLSKMIPSDEQSMKFFHYYRDLGYIIFAGLADIASFEQTLVSFLMSRKSYADRRQPSNSTLPPGVSVQSLYEKDLNWIGLLFAVLASGCQCSNLPRKERDLQSQVYVCCSFECLRITNFLSVPTLESVQALLVLGNVISNNMNAGTSWNLIGLTARLAQSLGLHQDCPSDMPPSMKALRNKVWWTLMWQDSLLSITYDRASFSALVDHSPMADPRNHINISPFHSAILRVSKVALDVVRDRTKSMAPRETFNRVQRSCDEIQSIFVDCEEHLRDPHKCRSRRESIEHWCLYLHVSYVESELCRPAISPSTSDLELALAFRKRCLNALVNTVEAWLGLQNITSYARQSWASVHRALSSALLLGIMREHARNERCRKFLSQFIGLMDDMTSGVNPAELAAPMTRAIEALKKIRIHETPSEPHPVAAAYPSPQGNQGGPHPSTHLHAPHYHAPPPPSHISQPPRFIEDIALGSGGSRGPSPRAAPVSPNRKHGDPGVTWPGSAGGQLAFTPSGVDESPYNVMESILWGNGRVPGAVG